MICGNCNKTDGLVYTSLPPKVRCEISKRFHEIGDECEFDECEFEWKPVIHGHWDNKITDARFDTPHTVARCSVCKGKIWVYAENYVVRYPYCPLCGAKMDEVEDGNDT